MYPYIDEMPISLEYFNKETVVCDIVYKPLRTKLLETARNDGFKTIYGIGMLINQAILSQQQWENITEKDIEKNSKEIKGFLFNY